MDCEEEAAERGCYSNCSAGNKVEKDEKPVADTVAEGERGGAYDKEGNKEN